METTTGATRADSSWLLANYTTMRETTARTTSVYRYDDHVSPSSPTLLGEDGDEVDRATREEEMATYYALLCASGVLIALANGTILALALGILSRSGLC